MNKITFICPQCKQLATLMEVTLHVTQQGPCTGWVGENHPESEVTESFYDACETEYQCSECMYEIIWDSPQESFQQWIARHQSYPPSGIAKKPEIKEPKEATVESYENADPEQLP